MKFRFITQTPVKAEFDLTPLIDCVFNLLLFFMLSSSFIIQPGIRINLPKAVTSEIVHEKNLVVTVTEEDLILLNENAVTLEDLAAQLEKGAKEDVPLLIRADHKASLGKVVEIWDLCRDVGLTRVNIATLREK
ncbi:MAG: biopolymer transporter ExbD [Candidatus Omnitrophota bacterium]